MGRSVQHVCPLRQDIQGSRATAAYEPAGHLVAAELLPVQLAEACWSKCKPIGPSWFQLRTAIVPAGSCPSDDACLTWVGGTLCHNSTMIGGQYLKLQNAYCQNAYDHFFSLHVDCHCFSKDLDIRYGRKERPVAE